MYTPNPFEPSMLNTHFFYFFFDIFASASQTRAIALLQDFSRVFWPNGRLLKGEMKMVARDKKEAKVHGFHACMSVWRVRPEAVVRIYLTEARVKVLSGILRVAAKEKKAYHVVSEDDLSKIAVARSIRAYAFLSKVERGLPSKSGYLL